MKDSDEQELERFLRRSSRLSRAYRELGAERPSPALDQAVIAAARSAIAERPAQRAPWRWPTLTALAATILLSFALVMRLALEPEQERTNSEAEPKAAREELPQARDNSLSRLRAKADSAPAQETNTPAPPAAVAPGADNLAPGRIATPGAGKGARAARATDKGAAVSGGVAPASAESTRADAESAKLESTTETSAAAAAGVASEAAAKPAAPAANETFGITERALGPAPAQQALKKSGVKPPEEWLKEIARLRESGDTEAAEREYAEFRKAYPDYAHPTAPAR